jgi:hypothetical protein
MMEAVVNIVLANADWMVALLLMWSLFYGTFLLWSAILDILFPYKSPSCRCDVKARFTIISIKDK